MLVIRAKNKRHHFIAPSSVHPYRHPLRKGPIRDLEKSRKWLYHLDKALVS